jgi:hypothetical protein
VFIILSLDENASAVLIQLNSAYCPKPDKLRGKQASTSAREKSQLIQNKASSMVFKMSRFVTFFFLTHLPFTNVC